MTEKKTFLIINYLRQLKLQSQTYPEWHDTRVLCEELRIIDGEGAVETRVKYCISHHTMCLLKQSCGHTKVIWETLGWKLISEKIRKRMMPITLQATLCKYK